MRHHHHARLHAKSVWLVAAVLVFLSGSDTSHAFQIAPLGSESEALLTNEPESSLARIAGKLGKLVKKPVHEEVTRLALDCTVDGPLQHDEQCARRDNPFASPFIVYGVRWNDLPPFRLRGHEGQRCKKFLTQGAACTTNQTVRFSTQPECWYCIFKAAEAYTGRGGTITGCPKDKLGKKQVALGNLLTRSHYGDLQFLHSMSVDDGVPADEAQRQVLAWLEFAWRVAVGDIKPAQQLSKVDVPFIADRFACTEWTVADLYILGRQDRLLRNIKEIAFGSVLHTVQDSFSSSHTERETNSAGYCAGNESYPKPAPIQEFHSYGGQDGHKHDAEDERTAMVTQHVIERKTEAVNASRMLVDLYRDKTAWGDAKPYMECLFELSPTPTKSSPGKYRRDAVAVK